MEQASLLTHDEEVDVQPESSSFDLSEIAMKVSQTPKCAQKFSFPIEEHDSDSYGSETDDLIAELSMDKLIGQQVRDRNRSAMLAPKKRPQHNNRFSVVLSKTGTER